MSSPRERIERMATRRHGVILRRQALEAGMAERQIKRRLERRQWVPAPVVGAYLLASAADDPASRLVASCRALDGIPWAQSAVAWWELAPHPPRPVVAIRGRGVCAEVDVIRPRDLDHVILTRRHGIEVPTVESAVATMAASTTVAGLNALLDEAGRRRLTTPERIVDALELFTRRGRSGSAVVSEVLRARRPELSVPLSDWGRWFADRLEANGLGRPVLEHRVLDGNGNLIAQVDAAYVDARLAFELDSVAYHHSLRAFETDRMRDLRLAASGWRTLRVTWHQYTQQWNEITNAVQAVRAASRRAG
jgi:hypothetical protein